MATRLARGGTAFMAEITWWTRPINFSFSLSHIFLRALVMAGTSQKNYADILAVTASMGREATKGKRIWCGNKSSRACHELEGRVFGSKCSKCGQYCHEVYSDEAAAFYKKHFEGNATTYIPQM